MNRMSPNVAIRKRHDSVSLAIALPALALASRRRTAETAAEPSQPG